MRCCRCRESIRLFRNTFLHINGQIAPPFSINRETVRCSRKHFCCYFWLTFISFSFCLKLCNVCIESDKNPWYKDQTHNSSFRELGVSVSGLSRHAIRASKLVVSIISLESSPKSRKRSAIPSSVITLNVGYVTFLTLPLDRFDVISISVIILLMYTDSPDEIHLNDPGSCTRVNAAQHVIAINLPTRYPFFTLYPADNII